MAKDSNMEPSSPALERGLAALEAVALAEKTLPFAALQEASAAPKSTLIRLLAVLRRGGWVERDSQGYRPGKRLSALRAPVTGAERLRAAAQPCLDDLCARTHNTVMLFQCEGETTIALAKVVHPAAVVMREVGSVNGIDWSSPWCWVQLAHMDMPRRESLLQRLEPSAHKQAMAQQSWRDLQQFGWCYDDQVGIPLVRRLAAPIHHADGRLIGVLALGGNPLTMPDTAIEYLGSQLVAEIQVIENRLV